MNNITLQEYIDLATKN